MKALYQRLQTIGRYHLTLLQMATCVYDVLVVGGGVVGCAIIHELTLHGYRCVLLEKGEHLVSGASAGNRCVSLPSVACESFSSAIQYIYLSLLYIAH